MLLELTLYYYPFQNVLGHTEDALSETLNHFYILSAHIIPTLEDQQKGVCSSTHNY